MRRRPRRQLRFHRHHVMVANHAPSYQAAVDRLERNEIVLEASNAGPNPTTDGEGANWSTRDLQLICAAFRDVLVNELGSSGVVGYVCIGSPKLELDSLRF